MDLILAPIKNRIKLLDDTLCHIKGATDFDSCTIVKKKGSNNNYYYKQYYKNGKSSRKYIGTSDSDGVLQIKKNEIRKIQIKALEHNIALLKSIVNDYFGFTINDALTGLPNQIKDIPTHNMKDYSLFDDLHSWANEDYNKNPAPFPDAEIYAKDGTRLRSKGECIWYNCLMEYGIPFRNEPEIIVIDEFGKETVRYPDFVIKCLDGSYIIIEHLGLLKKTSYATDFAIKLQDYLRSGYVLGDNLFLTSDEINGGTDSRVIKRTIYQILERMIETS